MFAGEISARSDPDAAEMRRVTTLELGFQQKIARICVHHLTCAFPNLVRDVLDAPYNNAGMEVIGYGYHSTVVRLGSSVLKIMELTEGMPAASMHRCIERYTDAQRPALIYLATYALEQRFGIREHPIRPRHDVVTAVQDYVPGYEPVAFDHLAEYPATVRKQLADFARHGLELAEKTQYIVDLDGADNIGLRIGEGDRQLALVDTVCLPNQPGSGDVTHRKLDAMSNCLKARTYPSL